ncbi:hypothetical protein Ngar_c07800 [Candidatus Nitrososphaera gargensis Ga9.2]|uniref:Uncharacterized protein n=1 Tax=Nitrososphaera gargensis (strain Ga9.2) TaxID=1237085 RepID=K0IIA0_NITGG|nr:hypothetical protein [Candidatus Nitrososphaera gargensis]AFU57722.1 hypothetical protein Ngar_c07800 [Candidatus Nitrososphaera gargensis Ga9.2]
MPDDIIFSISNQPSMILIHFYPPKATKSRSNQRDTSMQLTLIEAIFAVTCYATMLTVTNLKRNNKNDDNNKHSKGSTLAINKP